jgi:hypothetical protein
MTSNPHGKNVVQVAFAPKKIWAARINRVIFYLLIHIKTLPSRDTFRMVFI